VNVEKEKGSNLTAVDWICGKGFDPISKDWIWGLGFDLHLIGLDMPFRI